LATVARICLCKIHDYRQLTVCNQTHSFILLIIHNEFKYLGHFITNKEHEDKDVLREVRAMFTHANILARRFS